MIESFINKKDRIIASAIEIISDAGVASLTVKNLAMRENMPEAMLYRYFGGIDDVLVEVIELFTKYDKSIIATIEGKDISHFDKAIEFIKTFAINYTGYPELAAITLNYEVFLHNVNTRDMMAECLVRRRDFVLGEFQMAIEEKEIMDCLTAEELTDIAFGTIDRDLLNRRLKNDVRSHERMASDLFNKLSGLLKLS